MKTISKLSPMLHLGIIRKIAVRGWVPDSDGAKVEVIFSNNPYKSLQFE